MIVNLARERAQKENNNKLWTPRDTLEFLLKEIDEGRIKADALAIIVGERDDGQVFFSQMLLSKTTVIEFLGLAEQAKLQLALAGPK